MSIKSRNFKAAHAYPDAGRTRIPVPTTILLKNPVVEGKPIITESVRDENVFTILQYADDAMKKFGMDTDERRAVRDELRAMSDNEMFHAKLRFHFTIMADQYRHIDASKAHARNPYIEDCDNCDEFGMMPNYNPGGHGEQVSCDACGG